jgi:hypothetical protein
VCRVKNKFLLPDHEVVDGYRDVKINVLFEAENGLKIIGEIQVWRRMCVCVFAHKMIVRVCEWTCPSI